MPAFPTHGYSRHLLDKLSSPGTEGFSSFHIILHTMSPLIPRRESCRIGLVSASFCCFRTLSTVSATGYSCNEATSAFTLHCNLVRCAHSFLSMLSEGSAVLLSCHGASQATRPESLAPVGLSPTGRCVLVWTRRFSNVSPIAPPPPSPAACGDAEERPSTPFPACGNNK